MTDAYPSPFVHRKAPSVSRKPTRTSTMRLDAAPTLKTPQRSSFRHNQHHCRSRSVARARMSPSPSILKTPLTYKTSSRVKHSSSVQTGGDRFIPSRRHMNIDVCRRVLLLDDECWGLLRGKIR